VVNELKSSIDAKNAFFGIKQCLRKQSELKEVVLVSNCREEIKKLLKANNVYTRVLDLTKEEVTERLGLEFECEVFGIKK